MPWPVARQLAPFKIHWFEDVLLPDDLDGLAALRPQIHPVLLAGGEHEFTARDFGHIARMRALDLWQPDVTWCGGLTAALRIAELAQAHGIPLVPHRGGEIWGLHFLAAGYGDNLAEMVMGRRGEVRDKLWLGEPQPQRGALGSARRPGIRRQGKRGTAISFYKQQRLYSLTARDNRYVPRCLIFL